MNEEEEEEGLHLCVYIIARRGAQLNAVDAAGS